MLLFAISTPPAAAVAEQVCAPAHRVAPPYSWPIDDFGLIQGDYDTEYCFYFCDYENQIHVCDGDDFDNGTCDDYGTMCYYYIASRGGVNNRCRNDLMSIQGFLRNYGIDPKAFNSTFTMESDQPVVCTAYSTAVSVKTIVDVPSQVVCDNGCMVCEKIKCVYDNQSPHPMYNYYRCNNNENITGGYEYSSLVAELVDELESPSCYSSTTIAVAFDGYGNASCPAGYFEAPGCTTIPAPSTDAGGFKYAVCDNYDM
jgi:hypothetical protein